jgi:tetratricopeptide (TPR) repeat protein
MPQAPDPCDVAGGAPGAAVAPGPLQSERQAVGDDALALARLHVKEARLTSDPGFYTLAESALRCRLERAPDDREARRLLAHVLLQFHQFADVERDARMLAEHDATWLDWALLGDARMEQGKLDGAAEAYQRAVDLKPGLEMYDRIAWLRWLEGDLEGSIELQEQAVSAGSAQDPEPYAWVLTRLGWLHALRGAPSPELDQALALLPDYAPARLARGRVRLHAGDAEGARVDLVAAGRTDEAVWALSEIDPDASVEDVRTQDPRGYAMWLAPKAPEMALRLLEDEWTIRQDATTRLARAYAAWLAHDAKIDAVAEAKGALATGVIEPRVLRMGGLVLGDPSLHDRAEAMGPGLLPSERRPQ